MKSKFRLNLSTWKCGGSRQKKNEHDNIRRQNIRSTIWVILLLLFVDFTYINFLFFAKKAQSYVQRKQAIRSVIHFRCSIPITRRYHQQMPLSHWKSGISRIIIEQYWTSCRRLFRKISIVSIERLRRLRNVYVRLTLRQTHSENGKVKTINSHDSAAKITVQPVHVSSVDESVSKYE